MAYRTVLLPSLYQDSVVLMRIAGELRGLSGVRRAAALMGTPANHALLEASGLASPETRGARPEDLVLSVDAETEAEAEAALAAARALVLERRQAVERSAAPRPRTLDSALRLLPTANLVAISVPGPYAAFEALRALKRGRHVFLFSDNVPLQDEVALKTEAVRRHLLCMGPDCGTAYLNGVGLGFYNVVPRGRVGIVAASGTGLQAVASRLAAHGEGLSYGIGVGGRDLSAEVGGRMTLFALEALAADPMTEGLILVSKPPHPSVLSVLQATLEQGRKPTIVCCLGATPPADSRIGWVAHLDDAADALVARLRAQPWSASAFRDPLTVRTRLERVRQRASLAGSTILGLFTGGTLAHEARLVLSPLVGPVAFNLQPITADSRHCLFDLGDDAYTVGRPHPMIDPEARTALMLEAERLPQVGVLLVDLVLGRGSHPDPASPLASAWRQVRQAAVTAGRSLVAVASVIGTDADPQGRGAQVRTLESAGIEVLPTSAEAARFAALLVKPDLASVLLEESR